MHDLATRRDILQSLGAASAEQDELLAYNAPQFDSGRLRGLTLPLPDEPFVSTWQRYAADSQRLGVLQALRSRIVQLCFPIQENISQSSEYGAAMRKGVAVELLPSATGLPLVQPQLLSLTIHPTCAGRIPILVIPDRADFVSLVRALAMRNEPKPIPPSMGASIVSGLNNWDRVRAYRQAWEEADPTRKNEDAWKQEFQRLTPRRELYQDRVILLSCGRYSGVEASALGLTDQTWDQLSLTIRREHECTHYFTLRVFGSMRNNLIDEILADFAGIVAAAGTFQARWFLHFMGLENFPDYRDGGRLQNYRGQPPLSDGAMRVLQRLVYQAALNLEIIANDARVRTMDLTDRLLTLALLTLEELAGAQATQLFQQTSEKQLHLRARAET